MSLFTQQRVSGGGGATYRGVVTTIFAKTDPYLNLPMGGVNEGTGQQQLKNKHSIHGASKQIESNNDN